MLIIVPQWLITAWICIALQFYLKISCFCLFCFFGLQKISVASRWFLCVCVSLYTLLLLFSRPVVSDSLQPHELQHARSHCSSPSPEVCPSSCPLHWWCLPATSSSEALFSFPSVFPSIRDFSNESAVHIRWPKYWSFSFSISPSNEYSGLISLKIDCFDILAIQGALRSLL